MSGVRERTIAWLAESRWLGLGTMAVGWVLTGAVVVALHWAQADLLAVLLIAPAGILGGFASSSAMPGGVWP